jgi:hypothetical protein
MTDTAPEAASAPDSAGAPAKPPQTASNALQAVETAVEAAEQAEVARAAKLEAAVQTWVSTHLANSPVSRLTEAWNHMVSVLPHLTAALKDL